MKSLLVDALRQAQDGTVQDDPVAEMPAVARPGECADTEASPIELGLLDTGQLSVPDAAEDDHQCGAEAPTADGPIDDRPADDAPVLTEAGAATLAATTLLRARGARLAEKPSATTRLGGMTPLACVIALACAVAGYLVVDDMTRASLNEDLDEMADQARLARPAIRRDARSGGIDPSGRFAASGPGGGESGQVAVLPADDGMAGSDAPSERSDAGEPAASADPAPVRRHAAAAAGIDDRAYRFVEAGYRAYQAGRLADAEEAYQAALEIEPNHRDALLGLAAVFRQTDRDARAVQAYEQVLRIEPANTAAVSSILAIRSADPGWDGESDLRHLAQVHPDAPHLRFTLGSLYATSGRWAEARQAFAEAHRLDPDHAVYSYNLAVSLARLGDFAGAATYYRAALEHADRHPGIDRAEVEAHLARLAARLPEPS